MSEGTAINKARHRRQMLVVLACALGAMCLTAPRVFSSVGHRETIAFVYLLISMPLLGLAFGVAVGVVHGRIIVLAAVGVLVGTLITLLFIAPI
jgi:hypothetical protein